MLQAQLSHGIGRSPFDSPLIGDSVAAAMIVQARQCLRATALIGMSEGSARGRALLDRLLSEALLLESGHGICTAFPLLVGQDRRRYADFTDRTAENVWELVKPEIESVLALLAARGWEEWSYHFLWSQIFDSQYAWAAMTDGNLVPPLDEVVAWVAYPEHQHRSGTNYYPDTELRDHWLMVTWRSGGANTVARIASVWETAYSAALATDNISAEGLSALVEVGLSDSTGAVYVPVLGATDPLLYAVRAAATRYVDILSDRMPLDSLVQFAGGDKRRAFAMAYHDVGWGILERFVAAGVVEVVPALRLPDEASLRGVVSIVPAFEPFMRLLRTVLDTGA